MSGYRMDNYLGTVWQYLLKAALGHLDRENIAYNYMGLLRICVGAQLIKIKNNSFNVYPLSFVFTLDNNLYDRSLITVTTGQCVLAFNGHVMLHFLFESLFTFHYKLGYNWNFY